MSHDTSQSVSAKSQGWRLLRAAATALSDDTGSAVLARSAMGVFAVNVAGTALNMLLQIWLARLLGVVEFGIYVYVLSWLGVMVLIGLMGLDSASLRYVAAYRGTGASGSFWGFLRFASVRTCLLSFAVSVSLGATVWLLRHHLGPHKAQVFWLGCLVLPLNILIQFNGAVLQALRLVVRSQSLQFLVRLGAIFGFLAVIHYALRLDIDAVTAISVNGVSALLTLGGLWWLTQRELPTRINASFDPALRSEWRSVSRSLFAISGCQLLLGQADILLVGIFMDTTHAGLYAAASRIATLVTFGITSVNSVLAPTISEMFARKQHAELQATVTLAARGVLIYTVPVVAFLLIAGRWVLSMFGPEFTAAYHVLAVLAASQVAIALCGSVGFLLTMTGHQREALWVIAGSAALTLLLNLVLIPRFGLVGAAVGTMVATFARSLALSVLVRLRLQVRATAFGV